MYLSNYLSYDLSQSIYTHLRYTDRCIPHAAPHTITACRGERYGTVHRVRVTDARVRPAAPAVQRPACGDWLRPLYKGGTGGGGHPLGGLSYCILYTMQFHYLFRCA